MSGGDGIRPYAGEFLVSPAGLELSMNWCGHDCTYCFANLYTPSRRADIRGIVGLLSEFRQRRSREALLLQANVPMLVSNHVDPFAGTNAPQFEPIWELCVELGVQIAWQTRGAHKAHRRILDRVVKETPRSVWYISIPMIDDTIRARVEPHAPNIGSRLDLVQQLIEAGHVVTVGVNPLSIDWMPRFEPLLDQLKKFGVWGVWIQVPYFSKAFKNNLKADAISRLGPQFIKNCGQRGKKEDIDHAQNAMKYAKAIGLQVFSTSYEEPTRFFDPWHEVYSRVMPYWHQFINVVDYALGDEDEEKYLIVQKEDVLNILSPLPECDWAEPLRCRRAKHYRAITNTPAGYKLPKQSVEGFWNIVWNDDLFCKRFGPTSFARFAHACILKDGKIIPLLDENGDRLVLYRRKEFPYIFVETPELA